MLALNLQQLSKTYANGTVALKNINLSVKQGDFFALLGANGAGKSTIIGLISSLLRLSSGQIIINGYELQRQTEEAKLSLGLVPQEINLNAFETCEQILINQAGYYGVGKKQAEEQCRFLLNELSLWEKRSSIVQHLSGGMKRRLMIARALIHQPSLLILDEPTAGVDVEIRRSVWNFLKRINEQGTTILLTTHYLEEAEQLCKNIAIIDRGIIIKNSSMKELLNTLNHQTIIVSTVSAIKELPDLKPLLAHRIDEHHLELRIEETLNFNQVFEILNQAGIVVDGLRQKTNRLEELFLELINHDHQITS